MGYQIDQNSDCSWLENKVTEGDCHKFVMQKFFW